jgi:hypothetical protein
MSRRMRIVLELIIATAIVSVIFAMLAPAMIRVLS